MCFIRLAYFILALFRFYVTTGTIPYFDRISNISIKLAGEVLMWSTYWVCFIFLLLLKISSIILSPALRTFAPYIMQYNKGLGSRTSRRSTTRCKSPIILVFDVRLVVFLGYCYYPWWTPFLLKSGHWYRSLIQVFDTIEDYVVLPSNWFLCHAMTWPPDGILLRIVFFVFLLLSQFVIIAQCLLGRITVLIKHTTHSVTKYVQQSLLTR